MVLFVLALLSRGGGHVVEVGLSIASVAYGALLGVFLARHAQPQRHRSGRNDWHDRRLRRQSVSLAAASPLSFASAGFVCPKNRLDMVRAHRLAAYLCAWAWSHASKFFLESPGMTMIPSHEDCSSCSSLLLVSAAQSKQQNAEFSADRPHHRRRHRRKEISRRGRHRRPQRPHRLPQSLRQALADACSPKP